MSTKEETTDNNDENTKSNETLNNLESGNGEYPCSSTAFSTCHTKDTHSETLIEEPHCIHRPLKKLMIACIGSFTGIISPFSSTIYYPALTPISEDFNVTVTLVNLTVTMYMIFQAFSPSFWGPIADLWGRRPIFLLTLSIYSAVCIGLAMAPNFSAFLVLRMLQAFGSSSSGALGAGVIGDITTPSERGAYFSIYTSCVMATTAFGPIVGGAIAQQLSWRWVFWVLLIIGVVSILVVLFFLPETLRSLVGNGSIIVNPTPQQWIQRKISKSKVQNQPTENTTKTFSQYRRLPNFIQPFMVLRYPDVILVLTINGCYYAILFVYMTTTPTHFQNIYGLNTLEVGLCYIPYGIGSVVGSFIAGRILNRDFKIIAEKQGMQPDEVKKSGKLDPDFPIYRARLRSAWIQFTISQLVTIAYGWTLYVQAHLAVPLVLQFIVGLSIASVLNCCQTLMVDLFPGRSASITATGNIIKSSLGALATATVEPGIESIGLGYMFTTLGLILMISNAFIPVLIKYGPGWSAKRRE
ncbi:major facilitator superfamily domain-containing protein [Circinella umbellata]|nr:major facilitator superfamily domain-containing protein [Circinella umbellata]